MSLYQINNFLLILILLFNISSCSRIKRLELDHQQGPDNVPPEGKPDDLPNNPEINPPHRKNPTEKDKETDTNKDRKEKSNKISKIKRIKISIKNTQIQNNNNNNNNNNNIKMKRLKINI